MLQGTIPLLPEEYLKQKLEPHQQTLLQLAVDQELPPGNEVQAEIDLALDALELGGVWGKHEQGFAYVRAFLIDSEHLFVHTKVYAWDEPGVPEEIKARHFSWVRTPDDMFVKIMTQCQALERVNGTKITVVPEDHPEMDAVAFRVVEANEVWLIKRENLLTAIKAHQSIHLDALKMMQTPNQRRILGRALATGSLKNAHTLGLTLLSGGRGVVKEQRNAEERIRIDLTSKPLAEAFLRRARGRA